MGATGLDALNFAANDGDFGVPPLQFKKHPLFSFVAEHAVDGSDIVIHFFLPERFEGMPITGALASYWDDRFPEHLNKIAQEYFAAEYPRIAAQHIQELDVNSWWFKASGFAVTVSDVDRFVTGFYERLETACNSKST